MDCKLNIDKFCIELLDNLSSIYSIRNLYIVIGQHIIVYQDKLTEHSRKISSYTHHLCKFAYSLKQGTSLRKIKTTQKYVKGLLHITLTEKLKPINIQIRKIHTLFELFLAKGRVK